MLSFNSHASITTNHAQGVLKLDAVPQKVVTFDIASLDTLNTIGVEVAGLPQAFVPDYLSQYKSSKYRNVGSLFEPNYEAVASMQPDLIIVANRSAKAFKPLNNIAPTVDMTVWGPGFLNQIRNVARSFAVIFDKSDIVEQKLAALDKKVQHANALSKEAGNGLIILTSGGKISAYGSGSRFGWLHDELGMTPAIKDVKAATHGDPISFEFLLKTNPDWLFVVDRDSAIGQGSGGAKSLLDNPIVHKMNAYQNDQIIYLDPTNWYIVMSGLTAVETGIDEYINALQKSH
ncbi:iron ABC transporter substrate-binding protein [Vibrio sp. UCD-FRSSP16_10]|nr:iron ABC transporter substrate-binding protein [Vibrio sp. UCD-FRSSP16_30]OBT22908.1 iron ABC transporter substrate-binding protein [Vibrio sp. UCD-FRSSP16_10]